MIPRPVLAALALLAASPALAQHAGHREGHLGASVMPFDVGRAMHVLAPGPGGGVQSVVSRDGDPAQVALIRAHLRREAVAFARGDYADPAVIHGADMPGLADLRAGAARIRVAYETVPGGAWLRFSTRDPTLVAALHGWFAAQLPNCPTARPRRRRDRRALTAPRTRPGRGWDHALVQRPCHVGTRRAPWT